MGSVKHINEYNKSEDDISHFHRSNFQLLLACSKISLPNTYTNILSMLEQHLVTSGDFFKIQEKQHKVTPCCICYINHMWFKTTYE